MIDIGDLTQQTLDAVFYPLGVCTFWQRRADIQVGNSDEHIVYTRDDGDAEFYADNKEVIRVKNVTVLYRYDESKLETHQGRTLVKEREKLILDTMRKAEFQLVNGPYDAGTNEYAGNRRNDGFYVSAMSFEYWGVLGDEQHG